jgi:hypothetical protein
MEKNLVDMKEIIFALYESEYFSTVTTLKIWSNDVFWMTDAGNRVLIFLI